jgi:hypothetical protein
VLFQTVLSLATVFFGTFVQMRELFADLSRIFHWDFPIGVVPGAINWAIITDVTYSMYYLVPSIVFIVIQRWGLGRRMLLNLILFVADHPKGALYAISQISTAWITPIMKIFKK